MRRLTVHYFQHVSFEGLGYIRTWLDAQGHEVTGTRFYEPDYTLPDPAAIDALVVMGGPMSVHDDAAFAWLAAEKDFIRRCIESGKKVLGICLGAQLLAHCLGAEVHRAPHREIGWFRVFPTAESRALSWFHGLFRSAPEVLHWHGDQFEIPRPGGLELLYSEANGRQAFSYGDRLLGLQFHLEVTVDGLQQLIAHAGADLQPHPFVQSEEQLRTRPTQLTYCHALLDQLLTRWLTGTARSFEF